MRLREKLRKSSAFQTFFATIFIIPFQTVLLFPFAIDSLLLLQDKPLNLFQDNPFLLIGYILLPIIYCIIVSLFFQPKRLVSPLNVQIGTFVIFSSIFIYEFLKSSMPQRSFENLFVVLFIISIIIISIGFIQFFIVWWVVGLNYDSSDRLSFVINKSPKEVKKILGKKFLKTRNFNQYKEYKDTDNPIRILRCQDTFLNFVIIAFGSLENDENKCVLSTVAFHKDTSGISKSERATERRNSIIWDIKGRLEESDNKIILSPIEGVDDLVSITAFSYIESVTKSKISVLIGFFKRISKFFRRAIYFTVFAFSALTFACYMNYLDVNTYLGVIIPTIIALIIEVGIPLRSELSLRKLDDFN